MRPHGVRLISFISYTRHIYVYSLLCFGSRTLFCSANSSQLYPPNVIRVPRAETLLTTSFRFYLTIDTLVVQLVLYYRSRTRDFHSLDINHARHTKKANIPIKVYLLLLLDKVLPFMYFYYIFKFFTNTMMLYTIQSIDLFFDIKLR